MAGELELRDTFKTWLDKINVLIKGFNSVAGFFDYNSSLTSGFSVTFVGGKLRKGSAVETVAGNTFTLPPNLESIICIQKIGAAAATLVRFDIGSVPASNVIPIASLVTNGATVATYTDLRTVWEIV